MRLVSLPAFTDNYIWLLHDTEQALVVDPGVADPVLSALEEGALQLRTILVTHHHADHVGGLAALAARPPLTVYGPNENLPVPVQRVRHADTFTALGLIWRVLAVPGHTLGHLAYFAEPPAQDPILFCGDTLFSAGCGRLFEGTAAQMLQSLDLLAALPGATRVCCAHEYTASNLRFALAVEPDNAAVQTYAREVAQLRQRQLPTLPSTLERERQINPFLRTRSPAVKASVQRFDPSAQDEVAVFAALRLWKNKFQ